jgi:hypothetical protein
VLNYLVGTSEFKISAEAGSDLFFDLAISLLYIQGRIRLLHNQAVKNIRDSVFCDLSFEFAAEEHGSRGLRFHLHHLP